MAASTEPKRKGRYQRTLHSDLSQPTPRQWRLLRWLSRHRILSLPQIALLSGRTPHTVRQQLRGLFDAGLIEVLPVNRSALAGPEAPDDASLLYGSAPNVYVPTRRGLTLLFERGLIDEEERQRSIPAFGPRSTLALAHTLFVRDACIWLERCQGTHGGEHRLLSWKDGGDAALRLTPEKLLIPDAWFIYQVRAGASPTMLVGLVECDRGTERGQVRWEEKLVGYLRLFRGDALRRTTGYERARVLVLTLTIERRERLSELIARFDREHGLSGELSRRFWLVEQAALQTPSLGEALWQRPGVSEKAPLVSRELLAGGDG
jgi:DNA-binding CsgD family transcriptional regulator